MSDDVIVAADGGQVPGVCNTLSEFVRSLEDGQFDADCYAALRDLAARLEDHAAAHGKAKGSVTITITLTRDETLADVNAAFKVKAPDEKRGRTLMWFTDDNRLTRVQPRQHLLFGIREAAAPARPLRDAV